MFRCHRSPRKTTPRRGAAAVELALVLPFLLSITFAGLETGHALSMAQKLDSAVRDGGRLAMQDIDKTLLNGRTANEKVSNDIKNMLRAEGIPASQITVTITHATGANLGQTFDLGDSNNAYGLFEIRIAVPYSAMSMFSATVFGSSTLNATIIASRGRSTLAN